MLPHETEIIIIGAGPAGAAAASLLRMAGVEVVVLERSHFPRFAIGESLLPQTMDLLEEAKLLEPILAEGFQRKEGAQFRYREHEATFHFNDGFTQSWEYTFQVQRARFDQLLADGAAAKGAQIFYGQQVQEIDLDGACARVRVGDEQGHSRWVEGQFVLDASGFGRVLPRLLGLEQPPQQPAMSSVMSHVETRKGDGASPMFPLISVHPERREIWYWLIPFSDGTASVGVVAPEALLQDGRKDPDSALKGLLAQEPHMARRVGDPAFLFEPHFFTAYSRKVSQMVGPRFALLGNAGEFLDPVFSSGVTIALKSASLAAGVLRRKMQGDAVDWDSEFVAPLMRGVDAFRTFVHAWYDQSFQDIIFYQNKPHRIVQMLCSILAGYVWDQSNPYVQKHQRRLRVLSETIRPTSQG